MQISHRTSSQRGRWRDVHCGGCINICYRLRSKNNLVKINNLEAVLSCKISKDVATYSLLRTKLYCEIRTVMLLTSVDVWTYGRQEKLSETNDQNQQLHFWCTMHVDKRSLLITFRRYVDVIDLQFQKQTPIFTVLHFPHNGWTLIRYIVYDKEP